MSVVPYLTIPGGRASEAADFYAKPFSANETRRMPAEDKKRLLHCAIEFAGNLICLGDEFRNQSARPAMSSVFVGLAKAAEVGAPKG